MFKDTSVIPEGPYCYSRDNGKQVNCPYWSCDPTKPEQENGYCSFLEIGDWEIPPGEGISHLWDQVKLCDENLDFYLEDFVDAS